MRAILAATLALLLAGCATFGPTWSEISGDRYHRAIIDRQPALVEKVDGYSAYAHYPIKIEPGVHEIVLQGVPPRRWPGGAPLRTLTLNLEPCKRYYLNAQFDSSVQPTWTPVVDYVESIAGCRMNAGAG
ncbi:MAG TPA: hypothetical protein VFZ14_08680 [Burkholderiales bacterium]|nr:hypothetical protein [Burkholderiales bacterium]